MFFACGYVYGFQRGLEHETWPTVEIVETSPPLPTPYEDFLWSLSPYQLSNVSEGKAEEIASYEGKIERLKEIQKLCAEIQRKKYEEMGIDIDELLNNPE